jgi:hypothetical protein
MQISFIQGLNFYYNGSSSLIIKKGSISVDGEVYNLSNDYNLQLPIINSSPIVYAVVGNLCVGNSITISLIPYNENDVWCIYNCSNSNQIQSIFLGFVYVDYDSSNEKYRTDNFYVKCLNENFDFIHLVTTPNEFLNYIVNKLEQWEQFKFLFKDQIITYDGKFYKVLKNYNSSDNIDNDVNSGKLMLIFGGKGPTGFQGFQGPVGSGAGDQGPQGPQGFQGTQGFQGFQGLQGDIGIQGAQGAQGFQGDVGSNGSMGPAGLQGVQGNTGAQGPQGFQGDQGFQGYQGGNGFQGFQGNIGPQGADTGFQGFQGTQGAQGFQGAQGLQGKTGVQGPQGSQGLQGNTGVQGPQGSQGLQGNTGVQGPQGNQGTQGEIGIRGATGVQGPQGNTGAQGPQGDSIQGPQGNTGPTGICTCDCATILSALQSGDPACISSIQAALGITIAGPQQ